ncbi:MAG TPA: 16S rRNA (guanine(527)-N(7))-methyltransferase RsmG [Xanthobacteraceae bacterium]|jgi:16S rRNA (guanine527-N7)-methyltransferase|nr:16S rRNA (guanine(527)-N(7))-methyltransferase RsmG [Xanthobacteraceae bacterium]
MARAARPPVDDLSADRARALALTPVSRETAERLDRLVDLLRLWQKTTNLVAPSTLAHLWTRHVADSLQLLALAPDARVWVDLGSGGGFPGLPLACALAERPGSEVHLVESNQKKIAFLREAVRITGVPAIVHGERIEDFVRDFRSRADVVTARALAPLATLLYYVEPLLGPGTIGLLPKGQDVEAEIDTASKSWALRAELVPSRTDPHGRIVVVRGLKRYDTGS